MKKIYFSLIIACFSLSASLAQTVVVAGADAGTLAGNPYTTLKAAFDNINLSSQAGNVIVITVTGTTVEGATATLDQSAGPWASLRIIPILAASVTGNVAGPLVSLNGADNVTIDGLNLAGNSLALDNSNTSAAACTVKFVNDASANTIISCSLLGASGSAAGSGLGIIYFSSGLVTGNDNNKITQCNISSSASGNPINAICSLASSTVIDNSNDTISVNNISDYFNATAASCGLFLSLFNSGWTITNNTFYQTATRIATVGNTHHGILITSGEGYTISNNVIGFAAPNATGTSNYVGLTSGALGGTFPGSYTPGTGSPNATRYNAINCAFTTGGTLSSIQNNTIGGIALYTSSGAFAGSGILCGISVTSGFADIGTITGNTIGSSSGTSSIYAASATAGAVVSGIYCTSNNAINIANNKIGGIDVSGTTATLATGFKGIDIAGGGYFNVNTNWVGNTTANNIRTGYLLTGANLSNNATTPTAASGGGIINGIVSSVTGASLNISVNIIRGIQVTGTAATFTGILNTGNVSTTANITSNQIGTGAVGAVNFIAATSGTITGIRYAGVTIAINIVGNSVGGISCVSSGDFVAITNSGTATAAINIKDNRLGSLTGTLITFSGAMTNTVRGIFTSGGTGSCALTIENNSVRGIVHGVTATSFHVYISNTAVGLASINILGNTFENLNVNTTGNVTFIASNGGLSSTGTYNCSNNSIFIAFNKPTSSGDVFIYTSGNNNVNGSTMTETGNNFSNITVSGTSAIIGWQNAGGVSSSNGPTRTVTGNTFSNISGGSGAIRLMILNLGGPTNCSNNTFSNITGSGLITAIGIGTLNGPGTHNYSSNTISSLSSTFPGGNVSGITGGPGNFSANYNVNSNTITGLSSEGPSAAVEGIRLNTGFNISLTDNLINNLTSSDISAPVVRGIIITAGPANIDMYRNKIINLESGTATLTTAPSVLGIEISGSDGGATITNNFIAGLTAPAANSTDAIQGIRLDNNLYGIQSFAVIYNSIFLNASSTGTNFGTSGIYHLSNYDPGVAPLYLVDNIIVNTSIPNGTGKTVALRRGGSELDNYASTSDYNLFYAGTPSANRLLYYDGFNANQTMAAFRATASPREANSISLMPIFVSATDLHLTNANCGIDGKGTPAYITTDIDGTTRNATTPDIGADEFTATYGPVLAGIVGTGVCDYKTVSPAGTTYATSVCDLIARVVPSGANAVAGKINACVTKDVSQLYFNGEPYVQRHYDLEPVSSNQTTTSATITLYFDDAEFVLYNTNNPVYPPLPTSALGNTDPNRANVRITQFHGVGTGSPTRPGNYPGAGVLITPGAANVVWNGSFWAVTFSITGFSGFYAHTTLTNAPLPIVVNYLTGRRQGSNHLLNWKVTCNTSPRASMTLERSADSRNYTGINTITADAARCNQPFDYTDVNPLPGVNYYRLKVVDADGKVTYSSTVALLNAVKGFDIVGIAPNPVVNNVSKLNIASAQAGKMDIVIFDMQGRMVSRQSISLVAGFNSMPINVADLAAGTYTIKAGIADDQYKVIRFVKQ